MPVFKFMIYAFMITPDMHVLIIKQTGHTLTQKGTKGQE